MTRLIWIALLLLVVVVHSHAISAEDDETEAEAEALSDPSIVHGGDGHGHGNGNGEELTPTITPTPNINKELEDEDSTPAPTPVIKEPSQETNDRMDTKQDVGMRFVGFQGQLYTIPAQSGEVYNLITFPNFQLNARFVYLLAGECPQGVYRKANATCPARSGTYIDQLGLSIGHEHILMASHPKSLQVRMTDSQFRLTHPLPVSTRIQLRGHVHAMKTSHVTSENDDDESQTTTSNTAHVDMSYVPNMQNSTLHLDQSNHMMISSPLFSITVTNIAHSGYLDMTITLLRGDWIRMGQTPSTSAQPVDFPKLPLHGLLGQTWKNIWNANDRVYEGDVIDYLIASRDPFGTSFEYNLYQANL